MAVTGYGQESDRRRAQAAGFDARLVKPVDFDQLLRILVKLTDGPSDGASPPALRP